MTQLWTPVRPDFDGARERAKEMTSGAPSLYPNLRVGDRVRVPSGTAYGDWAEGNVELIWLGIEEAIEVRLDSGEKRTVYPTLGDELERLTVVRFADAVEAG